VEFEPPDELEELGQPTRERVARSILEQGPSTAAALAARLDLTPAAVRRHLDHLVADGALEPREPRATTQTRGRGRPAKVFAITEAGRDRFDQQYDDLALQALRFLAETGGEDAVRAFADRRMSFIEERFADVLAADPRLTPAEALARVFSDQGYVASVRQLPVVGQSPVEQLCQQHCPVSHVAHEFPQLCEAETAAISRALGRHVQRLATIAHGDGVCTTCIPAARDVASTSSTTDQRSTTDQNKREKVTT
jgi:predicted ArsR family transcriptional regulator